MSAITPAIAILLSTYNGDAFLAEQLESIQKQTITDWVLYIRDDGSTDNTLAIIHDFMSNDSRIILLHDTLGNLKPCQSFAALLAHYLQETIIPYVFFCDQDDHWLEDKLACQYAMLKTHHQPTLIFSDLIVTDAQLKTIHPSFLHYEQYIGAPPKPLNTLLVHNYITGCTIGMNRALATIACPIPATALMHDWWCALVAAASGSIIFLDKATVLYRQHASNSIGASHVLAKIKRVLFRWSTLKTAFLNRFLQARTLADRFDNPQLIKQFAHLLQKKRMMRLMTSLQLKLRPMGWIRQLHYYILLITR